MRSFFRFCVASKWITDNPAGDGRVRGAAATVSHVIVKKKPTLYFAKEEFDALLEACSRFLDEYGKLGQGGAIRLRTLMLLMRYSGHVLAYRYATMMIHPSVRGITGQIRNTFQLPAILVNRASADP